MVRSTAGKFSRAGSIHDPYLKGGYQRFNTQAKIPSARVKLAASVTMMLTGPLCAICNPMTHGKTMAPALPLAHRMPAVEPVMGVLRSR